MTPSRTIPAETPGLPRSLDDQSNGLKKLSLLAQHEVRVNRPETVLAICEQVREPILRGLELADLPLDDLAMTALATESDLYHVFSREERREHKKVLKAFDRHFDETTSGLRHALSFHPGPPSGGGWGQ